MGNIRNYNFSKLDLRLTDADYWDFYLAPDGSTSNSCNGLMSGSCFIVWYDFNNSNIFPNLESSSTTINSLVTWTGATNTGYTLNTIGLTGIDNGLITFEKISGDTSNQALLSALTGSTIIIPSGDTRLSLHRVTGTTENFIYPISYVVDSGVTGNYSNFCGGFYQGFYKLDGYSYEALPTRSPYGWSAEFWLNPRDICSGETGTTLNDMYPNNKGFFFYMGTRAENKFWNQFYGVDSGCTSGCTSSSGCTDMLSEWCTIPKETDISIVGDYNVAIPLSPPQVEIEVVTNPFLIYGRAIDDSHNIVTGQTGDIIIDGQQIDDGAENTNCNVCRVCGVNHDGLGTKTVCTYDGKGIIVVKTAEVKTNFTNPFLIYGRAAKSGSSCNCSACVGPQDNLGNETVCTFSGFTSPQTELNYNLDIIDNALGFRITDDGRIGYRLLTFTGSCQTGSTYVSGTTIEEGYSPSGIISSNSWSYIVIRYVVPYEDECTLKFSKPRKGKLMFYINGKLKFTIDEFDEFIARRLMENRLKQVGVPFNFSLGGGSQGLLESQTFDGLDMRDRGLPIEENFAGTFIGSISQFKFNICDLNYCDIQHNFNADANRYGINVPSFGHC